MPKGAHGLFKATGKKAKEHRPRQKLDFEPTPPEPTRALCRAELLRIQDFDMIVEPACGDGRMARDLSECTGLYVDKYDIADRGCGAQILSFYDLKVMLPTACIITNPPFCECHVDAPFVRHALETLNAQYLALLLPLNWTSAQCRRQLLIDHPPARIYVVRWRIDFTGKKAQPATHAWHVWDKLHCNETVLKYLDRHPID